MAVDSVFIVCDSPKHAKVVALANFTRNQRLGQWVKNVENNQGWVSVQNIGYDDAPLPGDAPIDAPMQYGRFKLACRKCSRDDTYTDDVMQVALTAVAMQGVGTLSLSALAAIVSRSASS